MVGSTKEAGNRNTSNAAKDKVMEWAKVNAVTAQTKLVDRLKHRLLATGVQNIDFRYYENCRHEVLNERSKSVVFQDVLDWIQKQIG